MFHERNWWHCLRPGSGSPLDLTNTACLGHPSRHCIFWEELYTRTRGTSTDQEARSVAQGMRPGFSLELGWAQASPFQGQNPGTQHSGETGCMSPLQRRAGSWLARGSLQLEGPVPQAGEEALNSWVAILLGLHEGVPQILRCSRASKPAQSGLCRRS